jgi:molybdopterin/thiamine biosynthesis adenylyltransferase
MRRGHRRTRSPEPEDGVNPDAGADPRYSRQVRFAAFGREGQRRLASSHALLVGVGALGTHLAAHLVRAGIGRLTLVDRDVVDASNLQRQVLFDAEDAALGRAKAHAAKEHLLAARPDALIDAHATEFDAGFYEALTGRPDLLLDGTDNFATRYLLNDLAVRDGTPWIHGGAVGATGSSMVVLPGVTPCLRCLMPSAPPTAETGSCETIGVLAPAVAHVAAFQAAECLKILGGHLDAVTRGVLHVDVWRGEHGVRLQNARPDPSCVSCGTREFPALATPTDDAVRLCGRNSVQVRPPTGTLLDLDTLAARLAAAGIDSERPGPVLRFETEDCRFTVFAGGRALLFGVDDPVRARTLYDRWVGAR